MWYGNFKADAVIIAAGVKKSAQTKNTANDPFGGEVSALPPIYI